MKLAANLLLASAVETLAEAASETALFSDEQQLDGPAGSDERARFTVRATECCRRLRQDRLKGMDP